MPATLTLDRFTRMVGSTPFDSSEVFAAPISGLLGTNPKVAKGEKYDYSTAILHLAPARQSGFQTCASASEGCRAACLNTAGRGGIMRRGETDNTIQRARRRRTHWYFARRADFMTQLDREIRAHVNRATAAGMVPCVRLNGTSDIRWENERDAAGTTVFERHPDVTFYDYTKHAGRDVSHIPNYSLTFSLSEANESAARDELDRGVNVAVVFKSQPDEYLGHPVTSGDTTDLRFLDPAGHVIGLTAKGKAKTDTSGFVR